VILLEVLALRIQSICSQLMFQMGATDFLSVAWFFTMWIPEATMVIERYLLQRLWQNPKEA
jgi:hypothetical protein